MNKLLFGSAGIPICAKGTDTVSAISEVKKIGLDAMELEFVRNINISKEKAPLVKKASEENEIVLTCHAPYYINLSSIEKAKIHASIKRIVESAKTASLCGAWSVCFHPAYYGELDKEKTYDIVKKNLKEVMQKLKADEVKIWVRPETMGKRTQFGDLQECVRLSEEINGILPCIDFSHLHARANGKFNTYDEFCNCLAFVEKKLGKEALKNMHIHAQGIEYSEKGERNHLNLKDSDLNYKDLLKAWKEFKICGIVICESPNIEEDALMMKMIWERM